MSESILDARPEEAARRLCLGFIDEALLATERLSSVSRDGEVDPEALHDTRVALRRLRSTLRAYREVLGSSPPKKRKRALSDLARATGDARDAEVQLAWASSLAMSAGAEQEGQRHLVALLEQKKNAGYAAIAQGTVPALLDLLPKLRSDLSHYAMSHVVFEEPDAHAFRRLLGRLLLAEVMELDRCLRAVSGPEGEVLAHEGRIHGKRIRYLLEPFKESLEGAAHAIKALRGLQELLGNLNDLAVRTDSVRLALEDTAKERARQLADDAVRSEAAQRRSSAGNLSAPEATPSETLRYDLAQEGLLTLLRQVLGDKQKCLSRLEQEWLNGALLSNLVGQLRELAQALANASAPREIERKYLLSALPPHVKTVTPSRLAQGYLPGEALIERVRKIQNADGERYVRTVKLGRGVSRIEVEEACGRDVFQKLWSLTVGRRVEKQRYALPEGDRVWEIDEFTDRVLVLAEIELASADEVVTFPSWLAPYVVRDVTDESIYVNAKLAQ